MFELTYGDIKYLKPSMGARIGDLAGEPMTESTLPRMKCLQREILDECLSTDEVSDYNLDCLTILNNYIKQIKQITGEHHE